jgi:HD superfamily phosphohydrolase
MARTKIFNDPVYGFITVSDPLLLALIEHPWLQRLARIRQLGLTYLVYPGALHTRFHHALGALHLVGECLAALRSKGVAVSDEEARAVSAAVLLHDIGHGPFSHALENTFVGDAPHERITELFLERLDEAFGGRLAMAMAIYRNRYPRRFLHGLVSGQLDMDRLDYLSRDSFYSGVVEGVVGHDRILKMLNVVDDRLVVEAKGIYSIEKFLIARRLMYWQVYLHKTVLAAEQLLVKIMQRARALARGGEKLFACSALAGFLENEVRYAELAAGPDVLARFARLDDADVLCAIKEWTTHGDRVLSTLSGMLIDRNLYKVKLQEHPVEESRLAAVRARAIEKLGIGDEEAGYFAFTGSVTNSAYSTDETIGILFKDGTVSDIATASDLPNISAMSKTVTKHFLCSVKEALDGSLENGGTESAGPAAGLSKSR